jgi:hypothetical protein
MQEVKHSKHQADRRDVAFREFQCLRECIGKQWLILHLIISRIGEHAQMLLIDSSGSSSAVRVVERVHVGREQRTLLIDVRHQFSELWLHCCDRFEKDMDLDEIGELIQLCIRHKRPNGNKQFVDSRRLIGEKGPQMPCRADGMTSMR